ncbi:N-methyl-D-aspartate receptor NMDAR2C subunit [Candidatus Woesearchaeota archaeon]|nr:N-methyl-D-aspartate receptor NMDAR2C subunit [Candidatus Woesearchaeota archaeon]
MKDRFISLWNRINAQGDAEQEFTRLCEMYSNSERFYHTMTHVRNCLVELDSVRGLVQRFDSVEFAIWYHDAIYDSGVKDNEERSAQLAYDVCLAAQLPKEFAGRVSDLILVTKHNVIPGRIDAEILIDVDLSILGKSPEEFDEYEKNIRREYSEVPEDKFRQGRSTILQMFLNRTSVYLTDFFKAKYEMQARKNLQRSINKLR